MQIIDNTVIRLLAPSDTAANILRSIDRSEMLHDCLSHKDLAVYWGYNETALLTRLLEEDSGTSSTVPSPMLRDYDWPGLYTPFEHQKITASFLSLRRRAFCFNEAGTGKTSAAIWAADYLMKLGVIKRVLIICPLSIMYSAWQADIFKTAMHRTAAVAHGSIDKRLKVIEAKYDFTIINFDGVNTIKNELKNAHYDLIIIDEANAYKSVSTKRWKTLAGLMGATTWLWMMTGTPASQSPVDAYGLAKLVSPMRVPRYATVWRDKVMHQVTRFKWMPKPHARDLVSNTLYKEGMSRPSRSYLPDPHSSFNDAGRALLQGA